MKPANNQTLRPTINPDTNTVYFWIVRFMSQHSYAPTIKEIATGVHMSSRVVERHLSYLQGGGHITREFGKPRTINVNP